MDGITNEYSFFNQYKYQDRNRTEQRSASPSESNSRYNNQQEDILDLQYCDVNSPIGTKAKDIFEIKKNSQSLCYGFEGFSSEVLSNIDKSMRMADETADIMERQLEWNNNPWKFASGSEAFQGHEIMNSMLKEINFRPETGNSDGTRSLPVIDEYGYNSQPPAVIAEQPGSFIPMNIAYVIDERNEIHQVAMKSAPLPHNTIETKDWVNLPGLTLDERKTFLDGVQKLIDQNGYGLDARYLRYSGAAEFPDINSAHEDIWGRIDPATAVKLSKKITEEPNLVDLLQKSVDSRIGEGLYSPTTQEYSIKVTDSEGNRLANDEIIIISGNGQKQVQMSVKDYDNLDRKQITEMLLKG
ncbi:MAG: hypothetical protein ACRC2T_16350 [Thermoguttaceae bacterium]